MFFTELPSFGQTILRALSLDSAIYAAVQRHPSGIGVALAVVFLAGLSEALGQSVVLFINQIRPKRVAITLLISAISHLFGYALWAAIVWFIGVRVFGHSQPFLTTASAVGLAYAPRLAAFFVLTPFLGNGFSLLLSLWSLLAIVVAVSVGLDMPMWQAVATSGLGWFAVQVWQRTLGRPVYAVRNWLEKRAAGRPLQFTLNDVARIRRPHSAIWAQWKARLEPPAAKPRGALPSSGYTGKETPNG
ncbi:MAG: YIP1 family protein [Caldilineaceae bacterium]